MPLAFLSHSSADKEFARRIANDLDASGIQVWLDEWELSVGECIPSKIQQGLSDARFILIALSASSVNSRWVDLEWKSAYWDEIEKNRVTVLPLLIEDCKIPLLLRTRKYADFRNNHADGLKQVLRSIRKYLWNDAAQDFFAYIPVVTRQLDSDTVTAERNTHWDSFEIIVQSLTANQRFIVQRVNTLYYLKKWGLSVRQLRVILQSLGYAVHTDTDAFDEELADVLMAFQEFHCLRHIDGIFGPLTYAKMYELWIRGASKEG